MPAPAYPVIPEKTALIVYDMTNDFVAKGGHLDTPWAKEFLVPRLVPFIERSREAGILVVF